MGNLRIKLKYKSFEIELEGDKETVKSEFKDIKENGLGNIVMGVDMSDNFIIEENPERPKTLLREKTLDVSDVGIPSLKDVLMKQLPYGEREWVLVYAFYSSDFGNKPFTSKSILECYESTKRKTQSRHGNMSGNIKALFTKGYFTALNDDEYILTDDGKHQANEIVTRSHSNPIKQVKPKSSKTNKKEKETTKKKTSTSASFEVLKDLSLRPENKQSLKDYMGGYETKSNADKIIVIVNYLKEILKVDKVSINHIYTAFWDMKFKIPTAFYQVVVNTKTRSNLLDYDSIEDINLSVQGHNRVRLDIVNN